MQKYQDSILKPQKGSSQLVPASGASVTVYAADGGLATLYSDNGTTQAPNPLTTDLNGGFAFYAADGVYSLKIEGSGIATQTVTGILLEDPADGVAVLASAVGAALIGWNNGGTKITAEQALDILYHGVANITNPRFSGGADKTGVADCGPAIQAALDYLNSLGGGVLFIPLGTFRKADTSATLVNYSNIVWRGLGDGSVILHDDTVVNARCDLVTSSNTSNIGFEDFRITGTALTHLSETNQSQTFSGSTITGLRMTNVTIEKVRFMATSFSYVNDAVISGCRFRYCVRDGARFTNSYNVRIEGNHFFAVVDDAVALHSLDAATVPVGAGFVVNGNTFEQSQGIKVLGAKALTIAGNVMRRMLRGPIVVEMQNANTEGNTPVFAVKITDNQIFDTFGNLGSNYAIKLSGGPRAKGVLTNQPGVNAAPYSYNYLNDIDAGASVKLGADGIDISGNTIARTLPSGGNYSALGYGQLFDRITAGFWSDPTLTEAHFAIHGLSLIGAISDMTVSRNKISGCGTGYAAISTGITGSTNILDFSNVKIDNNIIFDCPGVGIAMTNLGSGAFAKNVIIERNIIDLDPYFRAATHNADNTWSGSGNVLGIQLSNTQGIVVGGNVFRNMGTTGVTATNMQETTPNIIYADFAGSGDNASNKGVRALPSARTNIIVPIDGDPTSATFGQPQNIVLTRSAAMPSAGKYCYGHVVYADVGAATGTAGSKYTILGWQRISTGTTHVLNTDWQEMRCLTGT